MIRLILAFVAAPIVGVFLFLCGKVIEWLE